MYNNCKYLSDESSHVEDHVSQQKAPEQLINGPDGQTVCVVSAAPLWSHSRTTAQSYYKNWFKEGLWRLTG